PPTTYWRRGFLPLHGRNEKLSGSHRHGDTQTVGPRPRNRSAPFVFGAKGAERFHLGTSMVSASPAHPARSPRPSSPNSPSFPSDDLIQVQRHAHQPSISRRYTGTMDNSSRPGKIPTAKAPRDMAR